jgi:N-carbamoyl-L-amino-acid hydrolase
MENCSHVSLYTEKDTAMPIVLPNGDTFSISQFKSAFVSTRITDLIDALAEFGRREAGGISRVAFSRADRLARQHYLDAVNHELDVTISIDAMGNIVARRRGTRPHWPALITGSHLDTVPDGGAYDGTAGVVAGVEAFRVLDQLGIETRHPLELVVFTAEEPNPFGISTFGSRGLSGKLDLAMLDNCRDPSGRTLEEALKGIGGNIEKISSAGREPGSVAAFVELHIEQAPGLETAGNAIGIVSAITGLQRYQLTVRGVPAHAGTTLMKDRKDALCGAAEMVLAVEAAARSEAAPTVATVGRLVLTPNATNVVPRKVCMDAEIRSCDPGALERIGAALEASGVKVAVDRGVDVTVDAVYAAPPQSFSPAVQRAIGDAAGALGFSSGSTVSMAGHDAVHMGALADTGMIFIPCRAGLSHCPEEWAAPRDLLRGAQCLLLTLLNLDGLGNQCR